MNIAVPITQRFDQPAGVLASVAHEIQPQQTLMLNGIKRKLLKNTTLLYEEDPIKHVYEVISGTIKAVKILADGRRQVIGFFSTGDIIGVPLELKAFYSLETVTATNILCYPISQLNAAMGRSPEFTKRVFQFIYGELEKHMNHMVSLGRKRPKERVAAFLLQYHQKNIDAGHTNNVVKLPMTRIDISDYLGLTQETVCRVLSRFRRSGVIQARSSNEIIVLDLPALRQIAQSGLLLH